MQQKQTKKLIRGEIAGTVFTAVCGISLVYFIICFTTARILDNSVLQLTVLISAPIIMSVSALAAAFCNLKFGAALDKIMSARVREALVKNAALMHPERSSLTFFCAVENDRATLKVNGYKEEIIINFEDFGKLSFTRKAEILSAIEARISVTFCRLCIERGSKYENVDVTPVTGRKKGKAVFIIKNGEPQKHAVKIYLKSKRK